MNVLELLSRLAQAAADGAGHCQIEVFTEIGGEGVPVVHDLSVILTPQDSGGVAPLRVALFTKSQSEE